MLELTAAQREQIKTIGKRYRLKFALLYGSQARGQEGLESDIDVAVLGTLPLSPDKYLNIYSELMAVFGGRLDLKSLHRANILFRYQVMKNAMLLFGDRTEFNEYKAYAIRAYFDANDLLTLQEKIVRKRHESLMAAVV